MSDNRMDLNELRKRIDEVDAQLIKLFEARMDIAREVGKCKLASGAPVYDPKRERELMQARLELLSDPELGDYAQEFFSTLMELSRARQQKVIAPTEPRVAYQGGEGSYSELAAKGYFGGHFALSVQRFEDIFELVESECAAFGVLPVENSTTGPVHEVCDLMLRYKCFIVGEITVKVDNCVLGVPGATLSDIKEVFSKDQALLQCAAYLARTGWKQTAYFNTAHAARFVAAEGDAGKAAIAGRSAARKYNLAVLDDNLSPSTNFTRFHIVANKPHSGEANKASVCFDLKHESGSLFGALSHFAKQGLNMTRLESRPYPGSMFEYRFFVDFETDAKKLEAILAALKQDCTNVRLLGHYIAGGVEDAPYGA